MLIPDNYPHCLSALPIIRGGRRPPAWLPPGPSSSLRPESISPQAGIGHTHSDLPPPWAGIISA